METDAEGGAFSVHGKFDSEPDGRRLSAPFAGDNMVAVSAGIEPIPINPMAVEVMKEIGIDISGQHAKDVASILKEHFAYVVGVCDMAVERCPIFPFAFKLLKWSIESPSWPDGTGRRFPTGTADLAAGRRPYLG